MAEPITPEEILELNRLLSGSWYASYPEIDDMVRVAEGVREMAEEKEGLK